jgi:hypothetical protein
VSRLKALGWSASTALEDGLRRAYAAFLERGPQAPRAHRELANGPGILQSAPGPGT